MSEYKLGVYFFILGSLIAILSGAFPVSPGLKSIITILLVTAGVFVGLLNITRDQEIPFLIAVSAFVIVVNALKDYFSPLLLLSNIYVILMNLIVFAASAALAVSLRLFFSYASEPDDSPYVVKLPPRALRAWNITVLVAVVLSFVIFLLEAFFVVGPFEPIVYFLSIGIVLVFFFDLFVLYRESHSFSYFVKHHWIDILAVIPFSGVFQLAKLFRITHIVTAVTRSGRLLKISKITHSTKFFSHHSGFNHFLNDKKKTRKGK